MTVTKVVDEEKKERHQRRIVVTLFSICILGFSYLVYDYLNIINRTSIPEDFAKVDQTVRGWQSNGFVDRFDATQGKLVVNEEKWNTMTKKEKSGS